MRAMTMLLWLAIPLGGLAQQPVIQDDPSDVEIFDYNGDNLGDLPRSSGSSIQIVGENGTDGFEHRAFFPFSLTGDQRAAIANAQSITLDLQLFRATNVAGFQVDIYGLPDRIGVAPVASDFEAAASLLIQGAMVGESLPGRFSFAVTDFVKTEAARNSTSVILFRLQISPDVPNGDGLFNQYIFVSGNSTTTTWRPTLTVFQGSAPITVTIERSGTDLLVNWKGGQGPYLVEKSPDLNGSNWVPIWTTDSTSASFANTDRQAFYRVRGQ
jgi:hypothetical protein